MQGSFEETNARAKEELFAQLVSSIIEYEDFNDEILEVRVKIKDVYYGFDGEKFTAFGVWSKL